MKTLTIEINTDKEITALNELTQVINEHLTEGGLEVISIECAGINCDECGEFTSIDDIWTCEGTKCKCDFTLCENCFKKHQKWS